MSGSPCQGPGTGLPPPISNAMPGAPSGSSLRALARSSGPTSISTSSGRRRDQHRHLSRQPPARETAPDGVRYLEGIPNNTHGEHVVPPCGSGCLNERRLPAVAERNRDARRRPRGRERAATLKRLGLRPAQAEAEGKPIGASDKGPGDIAITAVRRGSVTPWSACRVSFLRRHVVYVNGNERYLRK